MNTSNDSSLNIEIPDDLSLFVQYNNNCNISCKFCSEGIHVTHNDSKKAIMSNKWVYDYFLPLYEKCAILLPNLGEITACTEGFEYLSFIDENYPYINIQISTNGLEFNEDWINLAVQNLMRVNFSINAVDEETFKRTVWNRDGLYTKIQKNLDAYLNILDMHNLKEFYPSVSCVINSSNIDYIYEFVKQYIKKGIQVIRFFFDRLEFESDYYKNEPEELKNALTVLSELNRVLGNKLTVSSKIFYMTDVAYKYEKIAKEQDIESLREKYSEILKFSDKFITLKDLHDKRNETRKVYGKKQISFLEDFSDFWCVKNINNNLICYLPFKHLFIKQTGNFSACCLLPPHENISQYIVGNKVDWNALFNGPYYKKLRADFLNKNYECSGNCFMKFSNDYLEYLE